MADLVDKLRFVASGQDDVQSQALTAAADEIERLLTGYREIAAATDAQMRDGDLAREIAARMLGQQDE